MGFKEEFKKEMQNVKRDLAKEVSRVWKVDYEGHEIQVINEMYEEVLIINGETVDQNERKSLLSHLIPYSKLTGTIQLKNGTEKKVTVKIGGYVKVNCIIKVGRETIFKESFHLEMIPWENKEKIVPFIENQVKTHGKVIHDDLPDDEYFYGENEIKMAPGLSDYFAEGVTPFYVKNLLKLFIKQINDPTTKTRKATYEKVISESIASYGEQLIEQFQLNELDEIAIQREALWLLENAAHREVVKFAVTILGCIDCEQYKEKLLAIGMHEEFTSYVIFALSNGIAQANEHIFNLAKSTHGWGKIAAVESLSANTPEIKYWLLTEGCNNTIMNEYLAYTCAEEGNLDVALSEDTITKELYDGAGIIIEALLNDEIGENMDDYQYANTALINYVKHAKEHCKTIEHLYTLMKINEFINEEEENWDERLSQNWKEFERNTIRKEIESFINDPSWQQLIKETLENNNDEKIIELAHFFKIDPVKN